MRRIEWLHHDLDISSASETEAEDDVVEARAVVSDDVLAEIIAPGFRALGEIALETSAADRADRLAIFGDDASRPGAAISRAFGRDDRGDNSSLAGGDDPL